jgi:hypothetical protein
MRTTTRNFIPLIASAFWLALVAATLLLAPLASADPGDEVATDPAPACTGTGGGSEYTGTQTTECESPGNVQIDATAPAPEYPFDDGFYGPGIFLGGGYEGPHNGGGGGGGGHR